MHEVIAEQSPSNERIKPRTMAFQDRRSEVVAGLDDRRTLSPQAIRALTVHRNFAPANDETGFPTGAAFGSLLVSLICWAFAFPLTAEEVQPRPPWTTSRVTGSPEPPRPYVTKNAFPHLSFREPVELLPIPGTDRLIVAELAGQIDSFANESQSEDREPFFDIKSHAPEMTHIYGLAFHPEFEENRQLFVCYVFPAGREDGSRVSRFRVSETDPPTVDPDSEEVLITWLSGGHNGGSLQFGPDGYLYISTGDGAGPNPPDPLKAGQDVSNLLSSVLRIDVDQTGTDAPYRIPPDNPFVDHPNARPEVWAYGFRNPWRMSFDRAGGDLWIGDVGWELWEMIYRGVPGGNYGWSITEGPQSIDPDGRRGPTPILPPTVAHSHAEAASITGGHVYWGDRLKELQGAYIYGDYETGKVWGLRLDDQKEVSWHEELADTAMRIVSFGVDLEGELYLLDYGGSIHRLVPNPDTDRPTTFPRKLSETGLFASVPDQQPAAGVVPYSIRATMWQDGATSRRWIALPGDTRVEAKDGKWLFPEGAVLVKTLSLPSVDDRAVHVETQLLHFDRSDWHGYSYRWNESQQDADLVSAAGDEAHWDLQSPSTDDTAPTVPWRYAARVDCMRCHNTWSGPPLAFDAMQLGSERPDGHSENSLERLEAVGVIRGATDQTDSKTLVDPHQEKADLAERARSHLHVNCAHCHRQHAGGSVVSQMQYDLELQNAQLLDVVPSQGDLSIDDARVISPGDPTRSVLLHRVAKTGQGRMPRLGSHEVDPRGLALLTEWIAQMDADGQLPADSQEGRRPAAIPDWLHDRLDDPDAIDAQQLARRLPSPADALPIVLAVDRGELPPGHQEWLIAAASEHPNPIVRDLFERFLPEDQRRQRLSDRIDPRSILALEGDPGRGERLFFSDGSTQCQQCHIVDGRGKELGPDLTEIGSLRSREELLRGLLEPSAVIDPDYQTYVLETINGQIFNGLLMERTAAQVTLRDAEHRDVKVPADEIEQLVVQPRSMMPDGQLRDLTAQEAADLLAFLVSLRKSGEAAPSD